jgi:hypothetical protein
MVNPLSVNAVAAFAKLFPLAPTQVPPALCAPLIAMFASVSVKLAPVKALAFGFVNVKVIVEVPPLWIVPVPNAFAIVGAPRTVRFAVFDVVPAVGVCVVVTPLVVFGLTPTVLEVTTTVTVQLPLAGMVNPLSVNAVAAFAKLFPLAPTQVPPALCAPLIAMFASVSVKLAPVKALAFGFVNVKVIVEVPPLWIVPVPNAFAIVGAPNTVTVFEPVLFASLLSVILLLGSTVAVFGRLPAEVGVTAKVTLNDAFAGIVTAPFATQLNAVPVIEQLIVPVGGVLPLTIVNAPCG